MALDKPRLMEEAAAGRRGLGVPRAHTEAASLAEAAGKESHCRVGCVRVCVCVSFFLLVCFFSCFSCCSYPIVCIIFFCLAPPAAFLLVCGSSLVLTVPI